MDNGFETFNEGVAASLEAGEHRRAGNFEKAQECDEVALRAFDQVLQADPTHLPALGGKGVTLASLGRLPEAVTTFETAIELDPSFAENHRQLGLCHAQLGDMKNAWDITLKAVSLSDTTDFRANASAELTALADYLVRVIQAHRDPENPEQEFMYYRWAASTFALACEVDGTNGQAQQGLAAAEAKWKELDPEA